MMEDERNVINPRNQRMDLRGQATREEAAAMALRSHVADTFRWKGRRYGREVRNQAYGSSTFRKCEESESEDWTRCRKNRQLVGSPFSLKSGPPQSGDALQ